MSEPMDEAERRRRALEETLPSTSRDEVERARKGSSPRAAHRSEEMARTMPAIRRDEILADEERDAEHDRSEQAAETDGKRTTLRSQPPVRATTIPGHRIADERPAPAAPMSDEVVTSARVATMPPLSSASGSVTLTGDRVEEALARELISHRFRQVGLLPEPDYEFRHGETLITLDGFDPARNIGYQFVSHADVDVVTDFDAGAEEALATLRTAGEASVLVIHDYQAPTSDALVAIVDEFLARLGLG